MRLFYQIAMRLAWVAALFAVLEIVIVVTMYVRDPETLGEDLVSIEAQRIVGQLSQNGLSTASPELLAGSPTLAMAVFDGGGQILLMDNPAHVPLPEAPLADTQSNTSREVHGKQFYLSGIRRAEINGQPVFIGLAISGQGLRPFFPALYREVYDHALLPLIPLSILLLLFNVAVVRRMVKPVERAVAEVDALDPGDPSRRLYQPASPFEVTLLIGAFNRALDRLEHAMQSLRQFTADVAHEVRTPLATMTLTIDRLPPSVEQARLSQDAASMTRLVGQILDLARTDALDDVRQSRSDLHDVTSRVVADMVPFAIGLEKSIRYCNYGSSVVEGRAELLERALRNLIENALFHTPSGSEVEVLVGPQPQIQVRDHGAGIPREMRTKVFERFWRADRQGAGAGLGLSIARTIIEACGGRIDIGDAPGGGALVCLTFPVKRALQISESQQP
jgi:signal transduction histidine kinase